MAGTRKESTLRLDGFNGHLGGKLEFSTYLTSQQNILCQNEPVPKDTVL